MQCVGVTSHSKLLMSAGSLPLGFLSVGLGEARKHDGSLSAWVREPVQLLWGLEGIPLSLHPERGKLMGVVNWESNSGGSRKDGLVVALSCVLA